MRALEAEGRSGLDEPGGRMPKLMRKVCLPAMSAIVQSLAQSLTFEIRQCIGYKSKSGELS